jgi:hypothetical protein
MHFSSIIITNTGWLLDKPRERARAKNAFETARSTASLYLESAQTVAFHHFPVVPRARTTLILTHRRRTHINASTHSTVVIPENSDRLEDRPGRARERVQFFTMRRTFASAFPGSCVMYSRYIDIIQCVSQCVCVCVCVCFYIYVFLSLSLCMSVLCVYVCVCVCVCVCTRMSVL